MCVLVCVPSEVKLTASPPRGSLQTRLSPSNSELSEVSLCRGTVPANNVFPPERGESQVIKSAKITLRLKNLSFGY